MQFVVDFLLWSLAAGVLICVPLVVRAWRAEVVREADPQFRPTSGFGRFVRSTRRRFGPDRDAA